MKFFILSINKQKNAKFLKISKNFLNLNSLKFQQYYVYMNNLIHNLKRLEKNTSCFFIINAL